MFPKDSPWNRPEQSGSKVDTNPVSPNIETGRPVPFKDLERWYLMLRDSAEEHTDDDDIKNLRDEIYALLRG
jgi:hypothetical protein